MIGGVRRSAALLVISVLACAAVAITAWTATARSSTPMHHCGYFKYGLDGQPPGPGGVTARGVSCWFARATALLGSAPGWHCTNPKGILYVCRPRSGDRLVKFYGE